MALTQKIKMWVDSIKHSEVSFIHLRYMLYPGQGGGGSAVYLGNTGSEAGIHA